MDQLKKLKENISEIEKKLKVTFKNKDLLSLAFIHRSFANESTKIKEHNERLEFLGDSVLGLIIADYLYNFFLELPEGELSFLRSQLVDATTCKNYLESLNVQSYLVLGKGEQLNLGRARDTLLANLFEAIIGAIYLDSSFDQTRRFFFNHFSKVVKKIHETPIRNWKSLLQEWSQQKFKVPPVYKVTSEEGPDHNKMFKITVLVNNIEMGFGEGNSKKQAQQQAAQEALKNIKIE